MANQALLEKLEQIKSRKQVVQVVSKSTIKKDIQSKVDEHIQLHAEMKALEKRLKQLREEIEPYMEEKGLNSIAGSEGGSIQRIEQNRPEITSRYTLYNYEDIEPRLSPPAKKKCIVKVIDGDAVKALGVLGEVEPDIVSMTVKKTVVSFTVKH